jgi:transposase InsO family protein
MILDLCSRVVVGWALSERITRELTLNALDMALVRRRPLHGLLHHSDRSSLGEFKRSSQHRTERGCDDYTEAAFEAGRTSQTALARPTLGWAA